MSGTGLRNLENTATEHVGVYRYKAQQMFEKLPGPQKIPLVIQALKTLGYVIDDSEYSHYGVDPSIHRPGWHSQYREFIKPGNDTLSNFNKLIDSIAEDYSSSAKDNIYRILAKVSVYKLLSQLLSQEMSWLMESTTQHPNTVSSASASAAAIPSASAAQTSVRSTESKSDLSVKDEAIQMYDRFSKDPENNVPLRRLFSKVRSHTDFPMKNGPDDSVVGKFLSIVPMSKNNYRLDQIINAIIRDDIHAPKQRHYTAAEITNMYRVFRDEMRNILAQSSSAASTSHSTPPPVAPYEHPNTVSSASAAIPSAFAPRTSVRRTGTNGPGIEMVSLRKPVGGNRSHTRHIRRRGTKRARRTRRRSSRKN